MSKKLIAVASAAALALTGLVGVAPAMAAPSVAVTAVAGAGTSADPYTIGVPAANALSAGTTAATLVISGLATGDVVRVDATGGVRLATATLTANANVNVATVGTTTYSKTTDTAGNITLYAFTTSTAAGTVVMTTTRTGLSASSTTHIKGVASTTPYNVTSVSGVPASMAKGATAVVSYKLTDVFGNDVEALTTGVTFSATSGLATLAATSGIGWDAATKTYKATLTALSTQPFLAGITLADNSVAGLADANYAYSGVVNNPGAATQVAALTAQVAALTAQVAKRVSKKKYNTLARKWNAAFPSQKVALKK
jgi:hypothetical protein